MTNGQNHWERQKREIDSYNIFYSSFHGVEGGSDLTDLGFVAPARFPEIPVRRRQKDAEPDFASFNGSTLLLAEVKSGSNLSNRVVRQMERCADVSIEDGEDYIRNSDHLTRMGFDHNNLAAVEPCIVFIKDRYKSEINQNYNESKLSDIENMCPILTQSRGGRLAVERGKFDVSGLDSFLREGVDLPKIPPTAVFLNEGVEKESLAVSICYDVVIPDLKHGVVVIEITEIDDIYPQRVIRTEDVADIFTFLEDIGACEEIENGVFEFRSDNQKEIFSVVDRVSENRVDEHIHGISDDQSSVTDFE